jgi:uncharacterized protein (TIGR03067 family)
MKWLLVFSLAGLVLSSGCSPDAAAPPKGFGSCRMRGLIYGLSPTRKSEGAMTRRVLVTLALGLTVAVACAHEDADDKQKLQGVWKAAAFEESGKEAKGARARLLEGMSWEFKGDVFVWRMEGQIESKGTYGIDPSKQPKAIDLFDPQRKIHCVGIYEFQGDTLKIRFNDSADGRPKAFTTEKGTRDHFLLVLERCRK